MDLTAAMKLEREVLEVAIDQTDHQGATSLRHDCYAAAIDLENRGCLLIDWVVFDGSGEAPSVRSIRSLAIEPKGREHLDDLRGVAWSSDHW
jgi:hypothetical protein